ncbi:MAG TPA: efflux RND transporter periplasmic adaptor subunit [Steroidobacteraceae bacterium]|nr:efflux RND transporter periplasmic adaptor subunit [Steroidobacteraceae bacterium]
METHDHPPDENQGANGHQHAHAYDHTPSARGRAFFWGGIGAGVLLVLLLLAQALWRGRGAGGEGAPALVHKDGRIFIPEKSLLRQRLTVAAAPAEERSGLVTAPGIVESDPARTVNVLPPGAGRVREVKAALGDRVQRGQVLATIDSPDLAQAYSDYDKAAAAAVLAAKNLKYQEEQFRIGAAAQRDLESARNDNQQAVAEYERSRVHLRAMGAAEDAQGEGRLLMVRAPAAGSITALAIAPGATINDDTQSIMTLADLSIVWVTALIAEQDVSSVRRNQDAEIAVDAYPGKTLHGKVLFVSDVIEPDSRRDKTRIAFPNPDAWLKPNMFATVTLRGAALPRVVLPSSALLMNNDRTSVFVATAPWTFERRTVQPLLQEGPQVVIESGVKPGEQVVVKGGILLND